MHGCGISDCEGASFAALCLRAAFETKLVMRHDRVMRLYGQIRVELAA